MKKNIIAGNWKMNLPWPAAKKLVCELVLNLSHPVNTDIILFPDFTILKAINTLLDGGIIKIGGQNMCSHLKGAFTGEVSAGMLLDCGCSYVLLGHSECRTYYGETNNLINEKVHLAIKNKLSPIICIGETLEERKLNKTESILSNQIINCFKGVSVDMLRSIIVAYEPVWAIGSGKNATPEQACESHSFIRSVLKKLYNFEISDQISIIYGGSINPQNSTLILSQEGVDGLLIGSSSLNAGSFYEIINSIN